MSRSYELFDWDDGTRAHIGDREISLDEIESAFADTSALEKPAYKGSDVERFRILGRAFSGRILARCSLSAATAYVS